MPRALQSPVAGQAALWGRGSCWKSRCGMCWQQELTLGDLHLREVEEALVAHVPLTATEKHLRAVLLLYAVIPAGEMGKSSFILSWVVSVPNKNMGPDFTLQGEFS